MRLYHGSKSGLTGTIAPVSRDVCDFGRGFYMGTESNDVIVGKIANDRMVVVLDWFFQGFISDIGLLESLQALNLGDQYCAKTAEACAHVRIVGEKSLSPNEREMLRVTSENQRKLAVRMVDRISLLHRRDGMSFQEIIERDTGRAWDEP